jgi:hypothetical protein
VRLWTGGFVTWLISGCISEILMSDFRFQELSSPFYCSNVKFCLACCCFLLKSNAFKSPFQFIPLYVTQSVQWRAKGWTTAVRSPARAATFPFAIHPIGTQGWRDSSADLTTHLHLLPRFRMRGAIPPHPPYKDVSKSFRTESITKYTLTTINTRWEAT